MTFREFIRNATGTTNWIVGRDCPGNRRRYGDDAVFLSRKQYDAIKAEWRAANSEERAV